MVAGIASFIEKFRDYGDCYTIIGGTACDILMTEADTEFRATKDIDMILILEARQRDFIKIFWEYVIEAGYRFGWKNSDTVHFYRFTEPKPGYPFMIELFSREPDYITSTPTGIIPIHVDDDIFLQTFLYQKYWSTNMTAHSVFSEKAISEGETAMIEDELTNDKMLPLPWVHFKFRIKANGQTVFFENELFHILFHQRIRVKRNRTFSKRGIYQISEIDLVSYDLLLTKKLVATIPCDSRMVVYPALIDAEEMHIPYENLMGDLVTKRFTNEDSYQFIWIHMFKMI